MIDLTPSRALTSALSRTSHMERSPVQVGRIAFYEDEACLDSYVRMEYIVIECVSLYPHRAALLPFEFRSLCPRSA